MISWKLLQSSSAFRLYCKGIGLDINEYEEIGKSLADLSEEKKDYTECSYYKDENWKAIIDESRKFIGVVEGISESPCSECLAINNIKENIGIIRTKTKPCCLLDGYNCDKYKYLKNDYLKVEVWSLIDQVCNLAKIPIPTIDELNNLLDDKTYEIYEKGLTCTINQADSLWATGLVQKYKPRSVAEMSAFVAVIRPGCASFLEDFLSRKPYTTGVPELDELLKEGNNRMLFQELIMRYLIWLGIPQAGSYDIIKKIAKKKFKEEELKELKEKLKGNWIKLLGNENYFEETWETVKNASRYSFNCISGDTRIKRLGQKKNAFYPTIEEMYKIKNDYNYAVSTNHKDLYKKYKNYGYGNAFSMFEDNRIHKNQIVDIYYTGIQKIYRIETINGSYVDCTMNHKFPTPSGEKKLKDLSVGNEVYIKGIPILIDKIKSITYLREDNVYDIEMKSPAHNFVSESGLVVSNCSHSLAYAYDSLYGAYLKSHYPLEYYTVALNMYSDDLERTPRLIKEMEFFNITLHNPKFRHSQANYFYDKQNNSIYKGISSVKFLNENCAKELYNRKDNAYNNFVELLVDLEENSTINSKQIKILIQLDFFDEFGKAGTLLNIYNEFSEGQFKYKKTYCEKTKQKRLEELLSLEFEDFEMPIKQQIQAQTEYYGTPTLIKPNLRGYAYILNVETKGTPRITIYGLGNGKTTVVKTWQKNYNKNKCKEGDIISHCKMTQRNKMKKVGEEWKASDELEWWLEEYTIEKIGF